MVDLRSSHVPERQNLPLRLDLALEAVRLPRRREMSGWVRRTNAQASFCGQPWMIAQTWRASWRRRSWLNVTMQICIGVPRSPAPVGCGGARYVTDEGIDKKRRK